MSDTPKHSIRFPDWLWQDMQVAAEREGVSISHAMRAWAIEWTRHERTVRTLRSRPDS